MPDSGELEYCLVRPVAQVLRPTEFRLTFTARRIKAGGVLNDGNQRRMCRTEVCTERVSSDYVLPVLVHRGGTTRDGVQSTEYNT